MLMVKRWLRSVPWLLRLRIRQLQWKRNWKDLRSGYKFAYHRQAEPLQSFIKKHKSILRRTLGQTDPQLQENKVVNLKLSVPLINGVLIRPGETFSLWKLVGQPTARRGYVEGLTISHGNVKAGVGGGLCQLANLVFWLGLHTPLEIAERHHHSFDLFPDDRRTIPFGSGTTIYFNYLDLRFYNSTDRTFQFHLWLSDTFLEGEVLSDEPLPRLYRVEERHHRFEKENGVWFRYNEIWRLESDASTGLPLGEKLLIRNRSEVKYDVEGNGALRDYGA